MLVQNSPDEHGEPAIAARLRGPGPAKYKLPGTTGSINHDATKRKAPAFSFGQRFGTNYESCSPGPQYLVPQFATRIGITTAPAYSLYSRQPNRTSNQTPAPGQYSPEKFPIPHDKKAPCFSFKDRVRELKEDESPAPNKYTLPSLMGSQTVGKPSAPAYSICGRPKIGAYYEDLQKTPGPGTYSVVDPDVIRLRGAAYSIKGRHELIKDKVIVPGPGAYRPEKVWLNKKTAPRFSFGVRHTEYLTMVNDTHVPRALENAFLEPS